MSIWTPFSYEIKAGDTTLSALDSPGLEDAVVDGNTMSAVGLLATAARDRVGDIFEVSGLDTTDHRRNPIVLLDHGLSYPLPIGKCEDEAGAYTVVIDENTGDCYQTTYFSQHSQVAEQVFHLISERILRANSIGYRELEFKRLPADPQRGYPGGKHILRSQLIEATWCAQPCNQDAVMATLSRDKICGKSLAPEIKAMLTPYIQERKVSISVPSWSDMKKNYNKAEPEGAVEMPADEPGEQTVEVKDDMPLGQAVLQKMSASMKEMVEGMEKEIGPCEHEKVKKFVSKSLEDMKAMCAKMDEMHEKHYGKDAADGDEEVKDDGDEEMKSEDDAEADDASEQDEKDGDEAVSEVKALVAELVKDKALSKTHKAALKYIAKSLNEFGQKEKNEDDELTATEAKEIRKLERAINRRVEILNRLISA